MLFAFGIALHGLEILFRSPLGIIRDVLAAKAALNVGRDESRLSLHNLVSRLVQQFDEFATSRRGSRVEFSSATNLQRETSAPLLFSENEQSPQFCGRAIVNNWKTKGHAGVTPRGLQRDCPPRPSRDSVSRRIMCGRACLSSPRTNYPQFRRAGIRLVSRSTSGNQRRLARPARSPFPQR